MRVLRVYHGGRDAAHRLRDRALVEAGVDLTLVVPASWPGDVVGRVEEHFEVIELPEVRAGDVNRHRYRSRGDLQAVLARVQPELLDLHEEPFSSVARQWLAITDLPTVSYTAQNVDKRWPPPFAQYESAALQRLRGIYPCSRQAASVVRGKGFAGEIRVLPLGHDADAYQPGTQSTHDAEIVLGLVGRLVSEKGVLDAVHVLAELHRERPAWLRLVGSGPEGGAASELARHLGVADRLSLEPWQDGMDMAAVYASLHVVLVPSRATATWVEQFGRVIPEAQAAGAAVAGYRSGSIPEVVADTGIVVDEGDRVELARQVAALLADEERYQALRRAGLEQAARMTWPEIARAQVEFYESVLAGTTMPAPVGRSAARAEFGATAALKGGQDRPFALPVLREASAGAKLLGAVLEELPRNRRTR